MKKKALISMLSVSCLFIAGMEASAEAGPQTSNGEAILTPLEDGGLTPVDPENPDPEDPDGGTGQIGLLTIDSVPNFNFKGEGLKGVFTDSLSESQTAAGYVRNVQVSDRRGTGEGWTLGLEVAPFVNGEVALKGAKLSLPTVVAAAEGNVAETPDGQPVSEGIIDTTTGFAVSDLLKAEEGKGAGTWLGKFEGANLMIADGNTAGTYSSTFTWSLNPLVSDLGE